MDKIRRLLNEKKFDECRYEVRDWEEYTNGDFDVSEEGECDIQERVDQMLSLIGSIKWGIDIDCPTYSRLAFKSPTYSRLAFKSPYGVLYEIGEEEEQISFTTRFTTIRNGTVAWLESRVELS